MDESQNPTIRPQPAPAERLDSGLHALALIAGHYRIAAEPPQLAHDLGLGQRATDSDDIVRAAQRLGLKARIVRKPSLQRLGAIPLPAMIALKDGQFAVVAMRHADGRLRIGLPWNKSFRDVTPDELAELWAGEVILIARRFGGPGLDPKTFGFRWFLPSLWRYRKPLAHVLDRLAVRPALRAGDAAVLPGRDRQGAGAQGHVDADGRCRRAWSSSALFDVTLQYLRTYALSHTTNRIDVELGRRLFDHLLRLPLAYFETRAAGPDRRARARARDDPRFLTGQGLTSALDLVFTVVFIAVLFVYSPKLTLIVLASIPLYRAHRRSLIRPLLRDQINERFNRGARQPAVPGRIDRRHRRRSRPPRSSRCCAAQWEEKLAAYVRTSFQAVMLAHARPERHPVCQQGDDGAGPVLRRAGGDRTAR